MNRELVKIDYRKNRRGLSTVVGAVFMIIIMASSLSVVVWSMGQQDRVTESIIEKTNTNLNRLNEELDISDVRISNNKLNVTVTNTGGAASNLKTIYLVNETASPKEQYKYDLSSAIDGRTSKTNIGQASPAIGIQNNMDYSIRVVAESGQSASTRVSALSSIALPMSIYVIPPTVVPGNNVTVLFAVTNNLSDAHIAQEIDLKLSYKLGCVTGASCNLVAYPSSANKTTLGKGNTALFKWVFKVTTPDKTYITFNGSLANARQGNFVQEQAFSKKIDRSQISGNPAQIVYSSLVAKPEIFMMFPSPYGDSAQGGLWGVVVANPTNVTMSVSRIVINMFGTKATGGGGAEIVNGPCTGDMTPIYPITASEWSCPHSNLIEWKDVSNPETILPSDVKSFLIRVVPDSITDPEPAFMLSSAVFTNMGQFTKTGYSSGMDSSNNSIGNVYLTNTTSTTTALVNKNMLGSKTGILSGSSLRFNITMADLDTVSTTKIKSGSSLVVNVPAGFNVTTPDIFSGFNTPTMRYFADGSTQITAVLSQDLGDTGGGVAEAKILSFYVLSPVVTDNQLYVMYILINGETSTNFSTGAVAEIVLQVVP